MKLRSRFLILAIGIALSGCASYSDPAPGTERAASGLPDHFLIASGGEMREPDGGTTCFSPLADPRDGAELRMVRSWKDGRGDYEVPAGRYGVGDSEVLRINCGTGVAIGIVPR